MVGLQGSQIWRRCHFSDFARECLVAVKAYLMAGTFSVLRPARNSLSLARCQRQSETPSTPPAAWRSRGAANRPVARPGFGRGTREERKDGQCSVPKATLWGENPFPTLLSTSRTEKTSGQGHLGLTVNVEFRSPQESSALNCVRTT